MRRLRVRSGSRRGVEVAAGVERGFVVADGFARLWDLCGVPKEPRGGSDRHLQRVRAVTCGALMDRCSPTG
jgi:hypothetical protein